MHTEVGVVNPLAPHGRFFRPSNLLFPDFLPAPARLRRFLAGRQEFANEEVYLYVKNDLLVFLKKALGQVAMNGSQNPLRTELQTYRNRYNELMGDEGKYALVVGEQIVGVFTSYEDALQIGYKKQGVSPFLVKKISAIENVAQFTRELNCPT